MQCCENREIESRHILPIVANWLCNHAKKIMTCPLEQRYINSFQKISKTQIIRSENLRRYINMYRYLTVHQLNEYRVVYDATNDTSQTL